jgi:hypothetical protein
VRDSILKERGICPATLKPEPLTPEATKRFGSESPLSAASSSLKRSLVNIDVEGGSPSKKSRKVSLLDGKNITSLQTAPSTQHFKSSVEIGPNESSMANIIMTDVDKLQSLSIDNILAALLEASTSIPSPKHSEVYRRIGTWVTQLESNISLQDANNRAKTEEYRNSFGSLALCSNLHGNYAISAVQSSITQKNFVRLLCSIAECKVTQITDYRVKFLEMLAPTIGDIVNEILQTEDLESALLCYASVLDSNLVEKRQFTDDNNLWLYITNVVKRIYCKPVRFYMFIYVSVVYLR